MGFRSSEKILRLIGVGSSALALMGFHEQTCVRKMELGPIGTNAYLLWEDGGKEAVLIDAPPDCATRSNLSWRNTV